MDRNQSGETTDPISSLQQDQISQSSDASDVFRFPGSTLIFGAIPFALPTSSSTVLLRCTKFLSLICLRILLFLIDIRRSSLKILSKCITPVHMVQKSSGKCRLIFYLSYLNRFVHFGSNPFGTKIIALCFICFSRASFSSPLLSNLDIITSKIFPDHRQNLGFSWSFGLVAKYFVFTVLLCHVLGSSSFSQS